MKKILVIAGTRPEIIKVAPVIIEGRSRSDVECVMCFTGQHREMGLATLQMFGLTPDVDLDLMAADQTLNHIGSAVMMKLPPVLQAHHPDIVLVQGDTTTAAFSALCSFHMKIPVGHIEAGLRSRRMDAPFPEEANRRLIGVVASRHFCPTDQARGHLLQEGVGEHMITVTGNTVVDALQFLSARNPLDEIRHVHAGLRRPFVLITAHRRESFGHGFKQICSAIRECATTLPHLNFVYPVHLNPNVQDPVRTMLSDVPNILLLPPVSYLHLLTMLRNCEFVLTDSGGIQEEAPSFGKFCIVMRDVTERTESITAGYSVLVGTDPARIVHAVHAQSRAPRTVDPQRNPYGDGHAAQRILEAIVAA